MFIIPFAGKRLFLDNLKDEAAALLLGITGGSLYFATENTALVYGYCSNVSLIVCVTPLTTALLMGWLYPSERLGRKALLASLVALIGVALVVFNGNFVLKLSPLADGLAFAACICWTLYSLLMRYIAGKYSTLLIMRKVFGYGVLTILPFFVGSAPRWELVVEAEPVVWVNLLTLGCVASLICYTLWNFVLDRLGTVRATNFIYFNPVVTMVTSWLVLGERITPIAIVGAVMVLAGMYWAEKFRKK